METPAWLWRLWGTLEGGEVITGTFIEGEEEASGKFEGEVEEEEDEEEDDDEE